MPRLYPFSYLKEGFESKRIWNKPPALFYTQEFQAYFKEEWEPIFEAAKEKRLQQSQDMGKSFSSFPKSSFNHHPRCTDDDSYRRNQQMISDFEEMSWRANPANPIHHDSMSNSSYTGSTNYTSSPCHSWDSTSSTSSSWND